MWLKFSSHDKACFDHHLLTSSFISPNPLDCYLLPRYLYTSTITGDHANLVLSIFRSHLLPTLLFKMASSIDLTEDHGGHIPPDIWKNWLPIQGKSVFHLLQFDQFPANKTHYLVPPDLTPMLHEADIPDFDYATLLQLGPPVIPSVSMAYQEAIRTAQHLVNSVTLTPSPLLGEPVRLPVWVFDYWREIELAASYQVEWRAALEWLESYSKSPEATGFCQKLLMALSFFSWSGHNTSVKDITSLLSGSPPKSYLSDFHIDHTIKQISKHHQDLHGPKVSGRHIITTVGILGSIITFYGSGRAPPKMGNTLWEHLAEIENRIVRGEVDSVGGVHHLPLHWVSVVFQFQEGYILYGDSLCQKIPTSHHKAFTRWVTHLYQRSGRNMDNNYIPVCPLPTGCQNDTASCGLFALNAIGHHYLGHSLLSPDPTSVACRRMEIALDLIYENTVCLVLSNLKYLI
jgi:hypothetical protein